MVSVKKPPLGVFIILVHHSKKEIPVFFMENLNETTTNVRLGHLVILSLPLGGRRALMRARSSTLIRSPCPVPGSSLRTETFLMHKGAL